jgi:hypothetical protein
MFANFILDAEKTDLHKKHFFISLKKVVITKDSSQQQEAFKKDFRKLSFAALSLRSLITSYSLICVVKPRLWHNILVVI